MKKVIDGKTYDTHTAILIARAGGDELYFQMREKKFFIVRAGDLHLLELYWACEWLRCYYNDKAACCAKKISSTHIFNTKRERYSRYMQDLLAIATR